MSTTASKLTKKDSARLMARRYLADKAYSYLLKAGQPAKLRQIVKAVDMPEVTLRLVKDVLAESDRFETTDRRWVASVRFSDKTRTLEWVLSGLFAQAGIPQRVESVAAELSQIVGRPAEYYEQVLPRLLADPAKFFMTSDGMCGLGSWLLVGVSESEEDVLFENDLSAEEVEEYAGKCKSAKWEEGGYGATAASVVASCKEGIPLKVLQFLAWRVVGEDLDPVEFLREVLDSDKIVLMSDQVAYPESVVKQFSKTLAEIAEEIAALPVEADEEEAEAAVTVTDTDKEEMIAAILSRGSATAEELLDQILEVSPEEAGFAGALESLTEALKSDERVMWLGGTRWNKVETFPDEVTVVPDSLVVPASVPFETPEGDVYDQELEEEGFDGDLKSAIYDPLAEDVTDEDPARTMYQLNGESQRCVLKYHHKMEGTFPLCQVNPEFFGVEPEIIPITLADEGKRKTVYVNNTTRLIYGLKDFYSGITEVSGAAFFIEKTAKPGEYRFKFDGEVDDQLGVDTGRSLELLDLKARFESTDMPLFDVVSDILQSKPGLTFAQLVNEVNIVKRCSRMLVASILSSYHCFSTRGKTGRWQYDEKKRSQGFNKTKRKYIKK